MLCISFFLLHILSLSDLLMKDSTNLDPGRVINISSTASVEPASEGALSSEGNGTWSCMSIFVSQRAL